MRSNMTMTGVVCGLLAVTSADAVAQAARRAAAFQPDRRLFSRLFAPAGRISRRVAPEVRALERERPANRECAGCEDRPGSAHLVMDSPRLTNFWLARHTYQSNGGDYGDNRVVADFWYDGVHRRLFSRSLVLHEVDDPADLRLGRAPGRYPNDPDVRASLDSGTTVGHVGFVTWNQNGFGSYFAAVQGAIRDVGTGYLDLATATGTSGRTRSDSTYDGEDLIKHVRLHPSGQLEVGFDTNPAARPNPSLLVRGATHVEGDLAAEGTARFGRLTTESIETGALRIAGSGSILRACSMKTATGADRTAAVRCDANQIAIGGGGMCASGELRGSRPSGAGDTPAGWEVTCSKNGSHTVTVVCCIQ